MMNDFLCPKIREFDEKATIYLKKKFVTEEPRRRGLRRREKKIQNNRKQS